MCGRFAQCSNRHVYLKAFGLKPSSVEPPVSFNVAPTQNVLAVAARYGEHRAALLRWGLVPSWATDPAVGSGMINARSESVSEKPAFREAFRKRRCLIPADGWFEWRLNDPDKIPFYVHSGGREPFAFAGLWEVNEKTGESLRTCAVLTCDASPLISPIHHRMPVILPRAAYSQWLDPGADPDGLHALLRPYEGGALVFHPVSKRVNSPRNNDPSLIAPAEVVPPLTLFGQASDPRSPGQA